MTPNPPKRNLLDDLIDFGRDVLDRIDEALKPPQERQPVRVPVPVRQDPRHPQNPYDKNPY